MFSIHSNIEESCKSEENVSEENTANWPFYDLNKHWRNYNVSKTNISNTNINKEVEKEEEKKKLK
jgi:hypothetical protein